MKYALALLAIVALPAFAVDVSTSTVVKDKDGGTVFETSNKFYGLSDKDAKNLRKRGDKVLSVASTMQDKKGEYTMVFTWGDEPSVETQGMKLSGVNATLRAGSKWLNDTLSESEARAKKGKNRPWGDN